MNMDGKIVLVTGASSGIGRATAVGLAKQGAQLLIVGRTPARCAEAVAAVHAAGDGRAQMIEADFSSLAGIRALADDVQTRVDRLDVLVNNAGTLARRRTLTADGYEATFAVNHLGYFLLTGLLLPVLRAADRARIVTVASEAHRAGPLDLDDLQSERDYGTMRVYSRSKTANILWTQELARRLDRSGITANSLHPGVIRTNLARELGVGLGLAMGLAGLFMQSPEKGAETSIYLASSPDVEGLSGRYYDSSRERSPAAHACDPTIARRLWDLSEELVDHAYP